MNSQVSILLGEIRSSGLSTTDIADSLGVVPSTVGRWLRNETFPHPEAERAVRHLHAMLLMGDTNGSLFAPPQQFEDDYIIRVELKRALRELRESLHRHARMTSRHELLDQMSLLLLSHLISVETGRPGIVDACPKAQPSELREFVHETLSTYLPRHISTELSLEDFAFKLKDSETILASEILVACRPMTHESFRNAVQRLNGIDVLNDVFGEFLAGSFADEKELGQYLTPPEIVRFMVRTAFHRLSENQLVQFFHVDDRNSLPLVLDPSCGVGSFLVEALRFLRKEARRRLPEPSIPEWHERIGAGALMGIDKSERMVRLSLCNLAMFGVKAANIHAANALQWGRNPKLAQDDLNGKVDLIITNPPFGAEFSRDDTKNLLHSDATILRGVKVESEILFLERYLEWLKPGGHLYAIVPDSILTNRGSYEALRRHIWGKAQISDVISLPHITFAAAGTTTKTSILHVTNGLTPARPRVYFAVAESVGFDVVTRGSQRRRVPITANDLPTILDEICGAAEQKKGCTKILNEDELRWDANYHTSKATLSDLIGTQSEDSYVKVSDIATLRGSKTNPARRTDKEFAYIEIADIDSTNAVARAKRIPCNNAPSRARNVVCPGDVLVSTVRPDQKKVGVVPSGLEGAVCSTGLAVLVPTRISSLLLAKLLTQDFVTSQLLMNNTGIAYPSFNEQVLLNIMLPIRPLDIERLSSKAGAVWAAFENCSKLQTELDYEILGSSQGS